MHRRPADRRTVALQIVDGATVLAAVYAEADAIAEPVEAPAEDPE